FLGGIKEMKKVPDAVFVVEPMEDKIAVAEAKKLNIPVFGIVDTNCDPETVDYPIAGNDDAVKSIKLIVGLMADAIVEAKGGLLEFAYVADEQPEVSMSDVIVVVQQQAEENERRRARYEERRQQQNNNRNQRGNRQYRRDNQQNAEPAAEAAQAAVETVTEAAEAVAEAVETVAEEA
ncbi:MAG: 30S ribosomal protein S2, partial [Erysipelotrichaceae bacterium]|nr:30S ribosomal protein S2 [Erysipelotrichaceae bacterium]